MGPIDPRWPHPRAAQVGRYQPDAGSSGAIGQNTVHLLHPGGQMCLRITGPAGTGPAALSGPRRALYCRLSPRKHHWLQMSGVRSRPVGDNLPLDLRILDATPA
jgi:hypothetical protein